jgi:hypothetical protein
VLEATMRGPSEGSQRQTVKMASATYQVPATSAGNHTYFPAPAGVAAGDTVDCKEVRDTGLPWPCHESPRRVRRLDLLGECPAWDEQ